MLKRDRGRGGSALNILAFELRKKFFFFIGENFLYKILILKLYCITIQNEQIFKLYIFTIFIMLH